LYDFGHSLQEYEFGNDSDTFVINKLNMSILNVSQPSDF